MNIRARRDWKPTPSILHQPIKNSLLRRNTTLCHMPLCDLRRMLDENAKQRVQISHA
jgi:hypothetical protein